MSFTQEYQKKLTTADEAVKVVKSGDRLEYGWCVTCLLYTSLPDFLSFFQGSISGKENR